MGALNEWSERTPGQRVLIAGVGIDPLCNQAAANGLISTFECGRGGQAIFVNTDVALRASRHPELVDLIDSADLVLADGMALVWASRLQGTPLPERVPGSGMLIEFCRRAAQSGTGVLLVGGQPGSAETTVQRLTATHPLLRVDWHTPPFGFESNPEQGADIDEKVRSFGRCLCFVGLGFPKQELLMATLHERFPDYWFIACGGTIDFMARGTRAPKWMQRSGLEWVYRLMREPRRLARRYLVDDVPFALRLLATSVRRGFQRG